MATSFHLVCASCGTVNRLPRDRPAAAAKCGGCSARLFTGRPIDLSAATFDRHLRSDGIPLLVDFWAAWCGPCKAMAPVLEALSREAEPRLRVAKLDTDAVSEVAARFGIRSIPTLILFKDGREVMRTSGAMSGSQLRAWLEPVLAAA